MNQLINVLFPEHTKASCSDESPRNAMPVADGWMLEHPCPRCTAIKVSDGLTTKALVTHEDYDGSCSKSEKVIDLPYHVEDICVTHDGGRLGLSVNGEQVFYSMSGTRDCSVEIERVKSDGEEN